MALINFAVTAKLICAFVFAYADYLFSHVAALVDETASDCVFKTEILAHVLCMLPETCPKQVGALLYSV